MSGPQGPGIPRPSTLTTEKKGNTGELMSYQAEYIWIDGTEPTPLLRSKTRIVEGGKEPGIWGFDGSSTNQAGPSLMHFSLKCEPGFPSISIPSASKENP